MKENDIVSDILNRLTDAVCTYLAHHSEIEASIIDDLANQIKSQDSQIRELWGGCNPYVAARSSNWEAVKQLSVEDVNHGVKVAESANRHGISRATLYRLIGNRK